MDDADGEITRLVMEFTQDVKGFFALGNVYEGTRYSMDLAKQIDGLWLPKRAETYLAQRILVSKSRKMFTVDFGNYRKFGSDAHVQTIK